MSMQNQFSPLREEMRLKGYGNGPKISWEYEEGCLKRRLLPSKRASSRHCRGEMQSLIKQPCRTLFLSPQDSVSGVEDQPTFIIGEWDVHAEQNAFLLRFSAPHAALTDREGIYGLHLCVVLNNLHLSAPDLGCVRSQSLAFRRENIGNLDRLEQERRI
jgi:hypothetical protein